MREKKIYFVSIMNLKRVGGVKSYVTSLSEAFKNLGINTTTISPGNLPFQKYLKMKKQSNDNIPREKIKDYTIIASIIKIISFLYILFKKPDVIFFQDVVSFNALYNICLKNDVFPLLVVHSYLADEAAANGFISDKSKTFKFLLSEESAAYSKAPLIFTVDERIKKYIIKNFNIEDNKILSFINFVNIDTFKPSADKIIIREKIGWPANKKIILCPRKLNRKNGVEFAVRAMKELQEHNYLLYVTGDGPERACIEKIIRGDGTQNSVFLLGDMDTSLMPEFYTAADFVIIPSITIHGMEEATSIAGLEAQSSGKIVIASNIGGLKQIIKNNETGILVNQQEPDAIYNALIMLDNDPSLKNSVEQNSRLFVKNNASHMGRAKEFLEIINNKLNK